MMEFKVCLLENKHEVSAKTVIAVLVSASVDGGSIEDSNSEGS